MPRYRAHVLVRFAERDRPVTSKGEPVLSTYFSVAVDARNAAGVLSAADSVLRGPERNTGGNPGGLIARRHGREYQWIEVVLLHALELKLIREQKP